MNEKMEVLHVLTWPAWFVCDVPSIHPHGDPRHQGTKEMMMMMMMMMRRRRRMNMVMKMMVMIVVVMIMNEVMIIVVMMRMNGIMRPMVSSLT
jgi:hypothetical protein